MKFVMKQRWWSKCLACWEMNRFLRLCGFREIEALGDGNTSVKEAVRVLYLSMCLGFKNLTIPLFLDMNKKWTNEEILECADATFKKSWLCDFYADQQARPRVRKIIEKRLKKYADLRDYK